MNASTEAERWGAGAAFPRAILPRSFFRFRHVADIFCLAQVRVTVNSLTRDEGREWGFGEMFAPEWLSNVFLVQGNMLTWINSGAVDCI